MQSLTNPNSDSHHTLIRTMLQEMIRCFRCKDAERFFRGNRVRRFTDFERPAKRRPSQLNAAGCLDSLNVQPLYIMQFWDETLESQGKGPIWPIAGKYRVFEHIAAD